MEVSMPINIPMPDLPGNALMKGLDTGSNMFARIMQQRLSQQAADRNQQLFPLRKQLLEAQLVGQEHKNDPMYDINQFQALANMLGGMGMPGTPQGEDVSNTSDTNSDMLRNNPLLRGWFKHKFGFDPISEGNAYQGVAREAYDLERLKNEVGENSPVYKRAEASFNAKIKAQEDLSNQRNQRLEGLKPGERWLKNDEGVIEGKEIPLTATERAEHSGRGFFNYIFPHINRGLSPFSGEKSIRNFEQAVSQYKTNPQAKKLVDDYLLAKKLIAAGVVKEAATLQSGRQKTTYQKLEDSINSTDIPKRIESLIRQYQLPNSANDLASRRFQQILSEGTKAGQQSVPAFQQLYFNPEEHTEKQKEQDEKHKVDMEKASDDFLKAMESALLAKDPTYTAENIKHTAKDEGITVEEVVKQLMEPSQGGQ